MSAGLVSGEASLPELHLREEEGEGSVSFSVLRASHFSVWEIHYLLLIKHFPLAHIL